MLRIQLLKKIGNYAVGAILTVSIESAKRAVDNDVAVYYPIPKKKKRVYKKKKK